MAINKDIFVPLYYINETKSNMILTITIILSALVAINFLLLMFSCNKTTKREAEVKKATLVTTPKLTKQSDSRQLSPTGS